MSYPYYKFCIFNVFTLTPKIYLISLFSRSWGSRHCHWMPLPCYLLQQLTLSTNSPPISLVATKARYNSFLSSWLLFCKQQFALIHYCVFMCFLQLHMFLSYVFFQFVISFICINNRLMSGVAATPFSISLHVSLSFTINKYNICLYINLSSSDLLCDVAHLMEAKLPHDATMLMASTIFMRCYMIASCT